MDKVSNEIIRKYKAKKGYSYDKLAEVAGVSKTYLHMIISQNRIPSNEILEKIAKALEFDPNEVVEYKIRNQYKVSFLTPDYIYVGELSTRQKHILNELIEMFTGKVAK